MRRMSARLVPSAASPTPSSWWRWWSFPTCFPAFGCELGQRSSELHIKLFHVVLILASFPPLCPHVTASFGTLVWHRTVATCGWADFHKCLPPRATQRALAGFGATIVRQTIATVEMCRFAIEIAPTQHRTVVALAIGIPAS